MLETNITNIENKEFRKIHDFYDIPRLNENIVSDKKGIKGEKEKKEGNTNARNQLIIDYPKEDMRYTKGIFKYLKKNGRKTNNHI